MSAKIDELRASSQRLYDANFLNRSYLADYVAGVDRLIDAVEAVVNDPLLDNASDSWRALRDICRT